MLRHLRSDSTHDDGGDSDIRLLCVGEGERVQD